jgi:hypothetical protein
MINLRKIWFRPEVFPIIACIIGATGLVGYRLWRAANGNEVQLVSKEERTAQLENIVANR